MKLKWPNIWLVLIMRWRDVIKKTMNRDAIQSNWWRLLVWHCTCTENAVYDINYIQVNL